MSQSSPNHKPAEVKPVRLFAVDALRGAIMVFMALDHANYFIAKQHSTGEYWGGPFPHYDSALAFMTRLVTHFCAPGFFLLMGMGMYLFAQTRRKQGWGEGQIRQHFIIRGAILIILQLTIVNFAWTLIPTEFVSIYIGVLFALGGTMILGSFLLGLTPPVLMALAGILFIGTEFLVPAPHWWNKLSVSGIDALNPLLIRPGGTMALWSNYPILPWLELVVFGILFGSWLVKDQGKAYNRVLKLGLLMLVTFIVMRALDGFGNIRPREGDSWIDFFNMVKYPPAITFTLFTTGVNLIVLNLFYRVGKKGSQALHPLVVFGRSPLFFYVLHLYLYGLLGIAITPKGTSLPVMYLFWILGLAILYPVCRWYGGFKHRQSVNSIIRFL
jgi:uncharacterized membrane protein